MINTKAGGKTFGKRFLLEWGTRPVWDPNRTPAAMEVGLAEDNEYGVLKKIGTVDADQGFFEVVTETLPLEKKYRLGIRTVDPEGLTSPWVMTEGSFSLTRETLTTWTETSVAKVQMHLPPKTSSRSVTLNAARNEYESFQVVVSVYENLNNIDVRMSDRRGHKTPG